MNEQRNTNASKREWVEPTLTHINAAETLGGLVQAENEASTFVVKGIGTFNGSLSH